MHAYKLSPISCTPSQLKSKGDSEKEQTSFYLMKGIYCRWLGAHYNTIIIIIHGDYTYSTIEVMAVRLWVVLAALEEDGRKVVMHQL